MHGLRLGEVAKGAEKMEQSAREKSIRREDQGEHISKKYGLWTTQEVEKDIVGCFGEPCRKEGKTGWRSPENVIQVDLGF
jgi:hypothetical protein